MEESIRPFMPIHRSITRFGDNNFLVWISPGELSVRTSQQRVCLRKTVHIGDRLRAGSAEFVVTHERDEHGVTVADIVNLYRGDANNQDTIRRVSELPSLPNNWREYFRKRLWNPDD